MARIKNTKAKGNKSEREIWHRLKDQGMEAVCSKASLGPADVVAWNNEVVRFIQSKNESKTRSYIEDLDKLRNMKCPPNGVRELWLRQRGGGWVRRTIMPDGSVSQDVVNK